jgi:cytochrome b561
MGVLLASTTNVHFATQKYGIRYSSWALISAEQHDIILFPHKLDYFALAGLITAHILAALKHQFIDKDNVLRRMLPCVKISDSIIRT